MTKFSKICLTALIIIGYMLLFGIFPLSILLCGVTVKIIKQLWVKPEDDELAIEKEMVVEQIKVDNNE